MRAKRIFSRLELTKEIFMRIVREVAAMAFPAFFRKAFDAKVIVILHCDP